MKKKNFLGLFLLMAISAWCHSADRALIVGVGEYYQDDINDLPGIDLDVSNMVNTAQLMGFKKDQIKVLFDHEATALNFVKESTSWLVEGVSSNDRILIYFSGHGTRVPDGNGDEIDDGKDEALVFHDAGIYDVNGKKEVRGFLTDDLFGQILDRIPSNNIMVFVDACNSGTSTRSLTMDPAYFGVSEAYPKFIQYEFNGLSADGDVVYNKATRDVSFKSNLVESSKGSYFALAAAQDNQSAIASRYGGYFTLGLTGAIQSAVKEGKEVTPEFLREFVTYYIRKSVSPARVYHPQLSGDSQKFNKPVPVASLTSNTPAQTAGTVWTQLADMSQKYSRQYGSIGLATNSRAYRLGDEVRITVDVPVEGYLNVITVDSKDGNTVLFPNQYHQDNHVGVGQITIPTSRMNFALPVSEPLGDTLVIVFLSNKPVNLYQSQVGGERDAKGDYTGVFAQVSAVGTRAISVAAKQPVQQQNETPNQAAWVRSNMVVVNTSR